MIAIKVQNSCQTLRTSQQRLGHRGHSVKAHFDLFSLWFSPKDMQTKHKATTIIKIKAKKEHFRSRFENPGKAQTSTVT